VAEFDLNRFISNEEAVESAPDKSIVNYVFQQFLVDTMIIEEGRRGGRISVRLCKWGRVESQRLRHEFGERE